MRNRIIVGFLLTMLSFAAHAQMDMKGMKGMKMPQEKKTEQKRESTPTQKKQTATMAYYTCVMHPEIHADKPGNCPKCGMKLVKKSMSVNTPMHATKPQQPMGQPATEHGGMNMLKELPKTMPVATYTCVMHPEIHANKLGNCPKCGMRLVKEKAKEMNMPTRDSSSKMDDMGDMKMDDKDTGSMSGMDMGGADMDDNMANTALAKKNLGPIKTITSKAPPHTVRYDLHIADTMVNYSGKKTKRAIAVNGQIPMPTLTFTEGDTAEIYVHNDMNEETSLHWHGLFVPNRMDGVPNLTQMPIKPHATFLYKFPIVQHGTHWYHSHTDLQEQIGMYGAFIIKKRAEWDIPTIPVVLSDWIDMRAKEVHRSLHNQTDWFGIRKNTIQSYTEAIHTGHVKTKVNNEWKRMIAMDVSDVAYDKFLVNGSSQDMHPEFKAGQKVRLRIANAGASSYFWLTYAGGKITVVATDGNDVEPIEVDRLIIAVSETYDVVVTIPESKSYEFLVTPEDRIKSASLWLGSGEKVSATKLPTLKYFAGMKMMNDMMDMNGNMVKMDGMDMSHQVMDMNTVMYPEVTGFEASDATKGSKRTDDNMGTQGGKEMQMNNGSQSMAGMDMAADNSDIVTLNYGMLRAPEKTTLPDGPMRTLKFDLTGNMNRYVWTLDNKTVSESDRVLIKKGENVRIILYNNTMMRHPMHLHGHDFRLLNGQGEYAIMKNVIDIMPMEQDTLEFAANEPGGDWFFHCHILYHMMSGMGRVFRYDNNLPNPEIPNPKRAQRKLFNDDREFHAMARIGLESNGTDGEAMLANTRWKLETMWHLGLHDHHGYESETMVGRYFGRMQWWYAYAGFDYHFKNEDAMRDSEGDKLIGRNIFGNEEYNLFGQVSNKNNRRTAVAGIAYTLPMLIVADGRVDAAGKLRFQLSREDVPVSPRMRFNFMINTDKEYAAGLRYIITKYFSLSTHYDSDMGLGAGVTITY